MSVMKDSSIFTTVVNRGYTEEIEIAVIEKKRKKERRNEKVFLIENKKSKK